MSALSQLAFTIFDGGPVALRILRAELSPAQVRRAIWRLLVRTITQNPFKTLPKAKDPGDLFTRRQLGSVLIMQDVLQEDLGLEKNRALQILERVVSESGALFIQKTVKLPSAEELQKLSAPEREGMLERMMARFGNATIEHAQHEGADAAFDVTRCHFVELTRALQRPELAPLFCKADSVYFARPGLPIVLERDETLAQGAKRCDFRFKLR